MYHATTPEEKKTEDISNFNEGIVRILCCTSCLGVVRIFLSTKCERDGDLTFSLIVPGRQSEEAPRSLTDPVQQAGRGGRDGSEAEVVICQRNTDRSPMVDPLVLTCLGAQGCLRKSILLAYGRRLRLAAAPDASRRVLAL